MANTIISLSELQNLLDTYGADYSRWPQEFVEKAKALVETSEEARRAYDEAKAVDALFAGDEKVNIPADAVERLMKKIDEA